MTDPILVNLEHVEGEIRASVKKIKPRVRVFLGAFLPALAVALFGRHLTLALVVAALGTAAVTGLNEADPSIPWSSITDAISRAYRGRP